MTSHFLHFKYPPCQLCVSQCARYVFLIHGSEPSIIINLYIVALKAPLIPTRLAPLSLPWDVTIPAYQLSAVCQTSLLHSSEAPPRDSTTAPSLSLVAAPSSMGPPLTPASTKSAPTPPATSMSSSALRATRA